MATSTTTQPNSYLSQYLTDYQNTRPDLGDIGKRVTATIQNTAVPSATGTIKEAQKVYEGIGGTQHAVAGAAINSFASQVEAAKKQQAIQSEALQTKAAGSQSYIEGLRSMAPMAVQGAQESIAAWNKYTNNADQYLRDSASRMSQVTADIKGTIEQYAKTNDAALANSIQSSSYTWLQTNKGTERGIMERYGAASAEYRDYQDAKRASIGAMVSDLTAKSWDLTQQIRNTGLGALAGAEVQLATDVNLAQKNALDAYQAAAAAGDQYRLDTSAFLLNLSAAENTEWGELANWIGASPVTAVDSTPMLSLLNELAASAREEERTAVQDKLAQGYTRDESGRWIAPLTEAKRNAQYMALVH